MVQRDTIAQQREKLKVQSSKLKVCPFMNTVDTKFSFLNFRLITYFIYLKNLIYFCYVKRSGDGLCWGATHQGIALSIEKVIGGDFLFFPYFLVQRYKLFPL